MLPCGAWPLVACTEHLEPLALRIPQPATAGLLTSATRITAESPVPASHVECQPNDG